jgi:hypothetical protein
MDHLQVLPLNICTVKATAAAGTTTTLTTTGATLYCIRGKAFSRAALTNAATPTTDFNTGVAFTAIPVGSGGVFVLAYDAGGTLRVMQGQTLALDANGNFVIAPQFPVVPETVTPFAYLVTRVGSTGAAWTFGASNLAGPPTGVTHTFVDVMTLPDRPQIS